MSTDPSDVFGPSAGSGSPASGMVNTGKRVTQAVSGFAALGARHNPDGYGLGYDWEYVRPDDKTLVQLPDTMYASGDIEGSIALLQLAKDAGYSTWEAALAGAALDPLKNQRSYKEFLQDLAEKRKALGLDTGDASGAYNGPTTTTYTTNTQTSMSGAAADIDKIFQQEMGRMATKEEIRIYHRLLNEQQAANPTVSVDTTTPDGHNQSVSRTTTGGFDPTRFAMEFVRSRPDYAETYAATTFMDTLDRFIANPNALDQMIG